MNQENAREIALIALQYLATDPERMGRFLSMTGIDPGNMRDAIREDETLIAILESLMQDESALLAYSENTGQEPGSVRSALCALDPHFGKTLGWEY